MCFEILGFDVLIDDKLKPWLIEINHAPSFATDTPLDFKMKKDVIADAMQLLGMTWKRKKKFIKSHKTMLNKRMLMLKKTATAKPAQLKKQSTLTSPAGKTDVDKAIEMVEQIKSSHTTAKKDQGDTESAGSDGEEDSDGYVNQYKLIYPSARNTEEEIEKYLAHAQKLYE